jgi:aminoglycoside phosphotransferase
MGQPFDAAGDGMPTGFFPAVEPDAAVLPLLRRLGRVVQAEVERHHGAEATIHTELRADRTSDGGARLLRFYWSLQRADDESPMGFAARTVYCDKKDPAPRVHVFPSEPVLTRLADEHGPLLEDGSAGRVEILRYIPLRRLTFRLRDGAGLAPSVIAKVKRPSGLNRAATAFLAVQEAAHRRGFDALTVPRVLRHDPVRQVLYLEELPGRSLDVALYGLDLTAAMEQLAVCHRDLQELDVRGDLPRKGTADWLEDARQAATQIGLFAPSKAGPAAAVYDWLVRAAPEDGRPLYCQGDFLPAQILCDTAGWAIIDLDDSRYADPLSDVAALYAALPREHAIPPARVDEARRTYLEAYARRAGGDLDASRWRWFLTMVELSLLAKRLAKGRATTAEVTRVLDELASPRASDLP